MKKQIVSTHCSHMPGSIPTGLCESQYEANIRGCPVKDVTGRKGLLLVAMAAIGSTICLTGCQTTIGGQTLPSPGYLRDDVQYFPSGPDFPHTNTVAAHKQYNAQQDELSGGVE